MSMQKPAIGGRSRRGVAAVVAALALVAAACGSSPSNSSSPSPSATSATPATHTGAPQAAKTGGSLTVLENSSFVGAWPVGLDPATNTSDAADQVYMDAIYGDLFLEGNNDQIVPDLATGYAFSDGGKTVTIRLRHGVTFSDGTPFDAAAVAFNIKRDLKPQYACICDASFPVASVTTPNKYTVVLHLTRVFAPIIEAFIGEAPDWIASPTALAKMGEKAFALKPVGAGPFEVVSDTLSSVLKLQKNPHYWQAGHPYLDNLTFQTTATDENAYEALLSGEAQAYQDLTTIPLVAEARSHGLTVTSIPASLGPDVVQLNTAVAPFKNIQAREAMYYATDPAPINKALNDGLGVLSQTMTIPGYLFYTPTVPGYRTYDLAKAKAIVKSLGGLSITLGTTADTQQVAEALQTQWEQAGMKVQLKTYDLAALIASFKSGTWQAELQSAGSFDPALGNGLSIRYESNAPFTGVHDPTLDKMIAAAAGTLDPAARAPLYKQIFTYISEKAYSPYLFAVPSFNLTTHGVTGPGLTSGKSFQIWWQDVAAG